jgi:hypothetical protein
MLVFGTKRLYSILIKTEQEKRYGFITWIFLVKLNLSLCLIN